MHEAEIQKVMIDDLAKLGEGVTRTERGILFIPRVLPGEEVKVEVIKKRRFPIGRVVEVVTPSPYRIEPLCPYFGSCTGCQWQHIDYDFQLKLKYEKVHYEFSSAGIEQAPILPVIPSPRVLNYRNHARFTVKNGVLGFVNREDFHFVPIASCYIMDEGINSVLKNFQGIPVETSQLSVRYGVQTGDILIQPKLESSIVRSGQEFYHEILSKQRFRISAGAFFQVNTFGAEKIVKIIAKWVEGVRILIDAYAGVGTFSSIFSSQVEKMIAMEESSSAFEDAMVNLAGMDNVRFLKEKAEKAILEIDERPDAIILDPPRSGCRVEMIQALLKLLPRRIIYVSCNPASLVRDIKTLLQSYEIVEIQPIDLFPYTHHVECVTILEVR